MINRTFLLLSSLLIIHSQSIFSNQSDLKYNIILIMADDSAADNYGCYGSTFFKTPILDRLANTGAHTGLMTARTNRMRALMCNTSVALCRSLSPFLSPGVHVARVQARFVAAFHLLAYGRH